MMGILELLVFIVVAVITLIFSIMTVAVKDVVHAAMSLLSSMFGVAIFYILLNAQFLGIVQILVYIGAVGVLILFAVMLTTKEVGGSND
jgi:NADH:ubiquinone oxidoreductase subunit 6 (subunit J)